jgi:hypothetical protein
MLSSSTRPRSLPLSAWAAHALDKREFERRRVKSTQAASTRSRRQNRAAARGNVRGAGHSGSVRIPALDRFAEAATSNANAKTSKTARRCGPRNRAATANLVQRPQWRTSQSERQRKHTADAFGISRIVISCGGTTTGAAGEGRWRLVGGSGAYTGAAGGRTLTQTLERAVLVGRLIVRGR